MSNCGICVKPCFPLICEDVTFFRRRVGTLEARRCLKKKRWKLGKILLACLTEGKHCLWRILLLFCPESLKDWHYVAKASTRALTVRFTFVSSRNSTEGRFVLFRSRYFNLSKQHLRDVTKFRI